jgi:hypothetical protein
MNGEIVRQTGAVLFVLALAVFAARKLGAGKHTSGWRPWPSRAAEQKDLQLIERIHLTPQHTLHRVRTPQGEILLVTHAQGVDVIGDTAPMRKGAGF